MNPRPFKENKSELKKFLERRNLSPIPKEARGKNISKLAENRYYSKLKQLEENATEEDKARLEAVSWNLKNPPNSKKNKIQWEQVESLRLTDGEFDPNSIWFGLYMLSGGSRHPKKKKGYYVAGVHYESKEAFLLSRTGLGKELM